MQAKPAQKLDSQATSKGKERAHGGAIDLRYNGSTSAVKLDDLAGEKSEPGKVRRRVQNMFKKDKDITSDSEKVKTEPDLANDKGQAKEATYIASADPSKFGLSGSDSLASEEDAPPTYSDSVNEYLLDPMQQFSAFPPVTLRKAQTEFRQSLRLATTLLSEQQRFGGMSTAASEMNGSHVNGDKA